MQYFIDFVSPGSAEADNGRDGKLDSHWLPVVWEILVSKIIKTW